MLASRHRFNKLCCFCVFLGCFSWCLLTSGDLRGDAPDGSPEKTDRFAAYRAAVETVLTDRDALQAESILLEMPDVDLLRVVKEGDTQLVELVALGDSDRILRQHSFTHRNHYFQRAAEKRDVAMIHTLLRCGFRMPESYNGLDWAVKEGDLPVVKAFLQGGAGVDLFAPRWENTLLQTAVYRQHDAVVDLLLKAKADVTLANGNGWTALHAAAEHGRIDYAEKLLAHGARVDARRDSGKTPIHWALVHRQQAFARWLLKHGATQDAYVAAGMGDLAMVKRLYPDPLQLDEQMPGSPSPAFIAAQANQLAVVKHFIGAGLNPNTVDNYGVSLLTRAAERGSAEVVAYLLEQEADPRLPPDRGVYDRYASPVHAAAHSGDVPTLRVLLDQGLPVDWPRHSQDSPLHLAAEEGKVEAIGFLVKRGAKINGPNSHQSPLGSAIFRNQKEACRVLLELGANPDYLRTDGQKRYGTLPLALATSYKKTEIFDLLLAHGASVQGVAGHSVLSQCTGSLDSVLFGRLLKLGARESPEDKRKGAAIYAALDRGNLETVHLLLSAGVKFNLEEDSHLAVQVGRRGDVAIMKPLLKQGLELKEAHQENGSWNGFRSALEAAAVYHRKDMTQFLLEQGMSPHSWNRNGQPLVAQAAGAGSKLPMLLLLRAGAGKVIEPPDGQRGFRSGKPLPAALNAAAAQGRIDTFNTLLQLEAWDNDKLAIDGLVAAARAGHGEIFDVLGKFLGREKLPDLMPALIGAVRERQVDSVRSLLEWGADPESSNLLYELCHRPHDPKAADRVKQIATLLVEHGARLEARDPVGLTAAHEAVSREQLGLAQHLVQLGTPLDLHLAAALGDLKFLKQHFKQHGNLDQEPSLPLRNHSQQVRLGSDPFGGKNKMTKLNARGLLTWAAAGGSAETVRWLIGLKRFDINGGDDEAPLLVALQRRQFVSVKELLAGGANVNGNQTNLTALIQAADWGDLAVVQLLLDHNASVRQAGFDGRTALHSAVQRSNLPVVKLLVKAEVPLDVTVDGTTALEMAFRLDTRRARKIALFLLDHQADPKAGRGESLFWAVRNGELAMVERLLKAEVDPNQPTAEGRLPLLGVISRYAQHHPRNPTGLKTIQLLLEHGAEPELVGRYNRTALQYAQAYKYPEAVELMKNYSARRSLNSEAQLVAIAKSCCKLGSHRAGILLYNRRRRYIRYGPSLRRPRKCVLRPLLAGRCW